MGSNPIGVTKKLMSKIINLLSNFFPKIPLKKILFFISFTLLICSFCQSFSSIYHLFLKKELGLDFNVYYHAAAAWKENQDPYSQSLIRSNMEYLYPAPALILIFPFTFLSPSTASFILILTNYPLLGLIIFFVLKLKNKDVNWSLWAFLTAFAIQTFSFKFNLALGQINLLVLTFCLASFYFQEEKKDRFAAFFLSAAIILKVWPIFLLPIYFWRRQKKFLLWLSFFLLLWHLPFIKESVTYFKTILPQLATAGAGVQVVYDQSLLTTIYRIFGVKKIYKFFVLLISLMLYIYFLLADKKFKNYYLTNFALIAVIIFARSPVWQHYFIYLFPLIIYYNWKRKWVLSYIWLILFFDFPQKIANQIPSDLLFVLSYQAYLYIFLIICIINRNNQQLKLEIKTLLTK